MRKIILTLAVAVSLLALAPTASQAWTGHADVLWLQGWVGGRTLREWDPNGVIRNVKGYTATWYAASCVRIVDRAGNALNPGQGYLGWVCAPPGQRSVATYDGPAFGKAQFYNGGNYTIFAQGWASYWTNP